MSAAAPTSASRALLRSACCHVASGTTTTAAAASTVTAPRHGTARDQARSRTGRSTRAVRTRARTSETTTIAAPSYQVGACRSVTTRHVMSTGQWTRYSA
ncbi:Uncharacterised protein [Mycobacteroides abscessus]|nr:Uncharacterised protein [Mycobacteroides abscessus]